MATTINSSGNKLDIYKQRFKIVNGRIGEDADIGSYTRTSTTGNRMIDYLLMSHDFFHVISDFIVHDLYTGGAFYRQSA